MYLNYKPQMRRSAERICMARSGMGKSYLMEHVAATLPEDRKFEITTSPGTPSTTSDAGTIKNQLY